MIWFWELNYWSQDVTNKEERRKRNIFVSLQNSSDSRSILLFIKNWCNYYSEYISQAQVSFFLKISFKIFRFFSCIFKSCHLLVSLNFASITRNVLWNIVTSIVCIFLQLLTWWLHNTPFLYNILMSIIQSFVVPK